MREIKFRLRDFQNKIVGYEKWYEGVLHAKDGYWVAKPQWLYSTDNFYWKPEYIKHRYKNQYTGLKDKNDKEIYEEDIVEYSQPGEEEKMVWKVRFDLGQFYLYNEHPSPLNSDFTDTASAILGAAALSCEIIDKYL